MCHTRTSGKQASTQRKTSPIRADPSAPFTGNSCPNCGLEGIKRLEGIADRQIQNHIRNIRHRMEIPFLVVGHPGETHRSGHV